MSRHRPLNGADSEEPKPYIVTLALDDHQFTVRVPLAYGPLDAKNQAEYDHDGYDAIRATPS